jgi:hypothetical protein
MTCASFYLHAAEIPCFKIPDRIRTYSTLDALSSPIEDCCPYVRTYVLAGLDLLSPVEHSRQVRYDMIDPPGPSVRLVVVYSFRFRATN